MKTLAPLNRKEMKMRAISIIIPVYNEEEAIEEVLAHLKGVMEKSGLKYEIIVVDDGSKDGTCSILSQLSGIKCITHKKNKGYGATLKTGIMHASFDTICITDGDMTYPNEIIPDLFHHMVNGNYDMVVGERQAKDLSKLRRFAKMFIRFLAEKMTNERIPDFNSGLRLFDKEIAKRFFSLLPDGFSFTTTITLSMINNGYLVDFVPIRYHQRRGTSKIHPIKDTWNFIILVLRISLYFQPMKIFMPISAAMMFLSVFWGIFSYLVFGRLADLSTIVLFIGGVQVGVTALLAELINKRTPNTYCSDDIEEKKRICEGIDIRHE